MQPGRPVPIAILGVLLATGGAGCSRPATESADARAPLRDLPPAEPAEPLGIGDLAPRIDVAQWLTRPAPTLRFEPGEVAVVEFVTSWCPHSRAVVPSLNALQRRYAGRGVTIVAVTHEPADDAREILAIRPGGDGADVPEFPVGCDPDLSTHAGYLDAVREDGVPTAFLIGKDGRLEWYGHPEILEEPLRQVVEGTWDRTAFAERHARLAPLAPRVVAILDAFDADKPAAVRAYRDLVTEHAGRAAELNEIAWLLVEASEGVDIGKDPAIGEIVAAAVAAVEESLHLVPDDGNTLDTLAHLQALRGDLTAALATQRRAAANPGLFAPRIRRYLAELEARVPSAAAKPG
ncbi:MAG: redoxin domain-containing protein [Planctomycetaceae bacterium]